MATSPGLRAPPLTWPAWLRTARAYLGGLRRKDRGAYRGIRGRAAAHWPELAPIFERIAAGYARELASGAWRPIGTRDDAATLCALVFEVFAWWAAEERESVAGVRDAERELLELQETIARAAADLAAAVARVDELCLRHALEIDGPAWVDDLDEALAEAAHRFPRWAQRVPVSGLIARHRDALQGDRPGVLDIVKAAQSVGVLRSAAANPMRSPFTGEWLRVRAPEVRATDERSAEALRKRSGSGAASDTAQLRLLFAGLREVSERNAGEPGAAGPLEWLTAAELSTLCRVVVDGGPAAPGRPWGTPSEGFDAETVRKARAQFTRDAVNDRKS